MPALPLKVDQRRISQDSLLGSVVSLRYIMNLMKYLPLVALLLFSSFAVADEDWVYLNRDEKVNRMHVDPKGKLYLEGQIVTGFELQKTADRIGISPISPNGKYAVLISFGDQDSQTLLLQYDKRSASVIPLQGTPMVWHSWSPDGSYLLLASYSDTQNMLYSIPLATLQPKQVPIQLQQQGEKTELVTTTVNWTAPDTFEMEATIHCASGTEGCDSQTEENVLRAYKLTVNTGTLQVTPEELPVPEQEM
jgi:hypothetical protein